MIYEEQSESPIPTSARSDSPASLSDAAHSIDSSGAFHPDIHPYLEIGKCLQNLRRSVFTMYKTETEKSERFGHNDAIHQTKASPLTDIHRHQKSEPERVQSASVHDNSASRSHTHSGDASSINPDFIKAETVSSLPTTSPSVKNSETALV